MKWKADNKSNIHIGDEFQTDGGIIRVEGLVINYLSKVFVVYNGIRGVIRTKELLKLKKVKDGTATQDHS